MNEMKSLEMLEKIQEKDNQGKISDIYRYWINYHRFGSGR